MRYTFSLIALLVATSAHAKPDSLSHDQCTEIFDGTQFLLSMADDRWDALRENSGDKQAAGELTWAMNLAGNYSTVYDTLCKSTDTDQN
jgi:hypothetical protein